jgi:uncharacterized protein (PEP-CTERM system associated)
MAMGMATGADDRNARHRDALTRIGVAAVAALAIAQQVHAQSETFRITPTISLRETLTDNVNLSPPDVAISDSITEIIPGVQISADGKRLKLFLTYTLDFLLYARTASTNNNTQSYLNATAKYEAIDDWLFIDAQAYVSQQAILPFGPVPVYSTDNRNRTQTQTYQVSPYIHGPIGADVAFYELRYSGVYNTSQDGAYDASVQSTWSGFIRGNTYFQNLGWVVSGNSQTNNYNQGRDSSSAMYNGALNYRFNEEFRINALVGRERNDYTTLDQTWYTNYGGGFEWTPTDRTKIIGFQEHRFFGNGWNYSITQRSPYFTFGASSVQNVNTNSSQQLSGAGGVAYDLLFASLTTRIPDPVQRAAEATRLLQQSGIPSDLFLPNGFAYNQPVVQQTNSASVLFNGTRNTIAAAINQTKQRPLQVGVTDPSNFNAPNATNQIGVSASWTYALTAITSLNLTGSRFRTTGGDSTLASKQWNANVLLTTQLGPRTSASLGARYVRFNSDQLDQTDYTERAVVASISYRF